MANAKSEQPATYYLIVSKDYFKQQIEERIALGKVLLNTQISTIREIKELRDKYDDWNEYNSELLKVSFNSTNSDYKIDYDRCNDHMIFTGWANVTEELADLKEDIDTKVHNLEKLITKLPLIKSLEANNDVINENKSDVGKNRNVFIVHGHNNEKKLEVSQTISRLGLIPIILHEQPNNGATIIEKFEKNAEVGYAVVLLTDDDEGKAKTEENYKLRARQNVILELGYFLGKLGRAHVCALYIDGVDLPNDISGLLYIQLDHSGKWKFDLAKELKTAGYEIDANSLL